MKRCPMRDSIPVRSARRILLVLGLVAAPLRAQNPPATGTGKAEIVGVVVDSLDGKYLSGAEVLLDVGNRTVVTDSAGRFRIDSLAPGTYRVGAFHPLLDTLGIDLLTKPFHLGPDSSGVVVLAVPSAATLVHQSCPGSSGEASAVIGHVVDPETLVPVPNAEVSIAWTEISISKSTGLQRTAHLLRDTTSATGAFQLCGLPNSLSATLQARRGSALTAEIPITLGERPVEFLARTLLLASTDSAVRTGSAAVSGIVELEGGTSNAGTRVELEGSDAVALTDAQGRFTLQNLPAGSRVLTARHIGFAAQTVAVDLSAREEKKVNVKLPKFVPVMDPVLVLARRSAELDKIGFSQRRKTGSGYFIGPDQLRDAHPFYLTDILRRVPSLHITSTPDGEVVTSSRGVGSSCVQYYLDDVPYTEMTPGDINNFVNGSEVVAVEVYQPGLAPAQYVRLGGSCTTIILWTRFRIRG